jgi:hypothetical protein
VEELIIVLLHGLFEFIFNVLSGSPGWPSKQQAASDDKNNVGGWLIWVLAGGLMAGLSLVFFNHTFIPTSELRIANLFLSPIASGFLTQHIAKQRAKTNPNIVPHHHFWQAFWYSSGFVVVRFAYALRG